MSDSKKDSDELDPEIADLIGVDDDDSDNPDFFDLFTDEAKDTEEISHGDGIAIKPKFAEITKFEEDPKPYFTDKDYYKIVLSGEGEISQKIHVLLSNFLKTEEPKDKLLHRERLIVAYWQLGASIAGKISRTLPVPKKMLLRFGVLLQTLISKEQRLLLSKVIENNDTGEPIFYIDEWLSKISSGDINPSIVDETKKGKGKKQARKANIALDRERAHKESVFTLMKQKALQITDMEALLMEKAAVIKKHELITRYGNLIAPYSSEQRTFLSEIQEFSKRLLQSDKELSLAIDNMDNSTEKLKELEEKAKEEGGEEAVDSQVLIEEFMTLRQMIKMTVGKKGNHFPILMQQYMRTSMIDIATRENVITTMAEVEKVDPGLFQRTFKRQTNRIVPYTILLPSYGEVGVCWEPYEKFNRATGRGRIGIPMFSKDLKTAIIYAMADLRWQTAKETASYYWMEEGLTGRYYQWFTDQKMRGDVKESFMQNYYLWVTKEADGMQKLERDVRGVFWRNIPFPQDLKDKLRNRGFVYNELYKKDMNRAMSDGY
ncbi:MAG: hypothetical protein FWD87_06365 [Spirochaetaceae bacterium]|nr:hypothetical protein [Spirochaetaceae bacterium]